MECVPGSTEFFETQEGCCCLISCYREGFVCAYTTELCGEVGWEVSREGHWRRDLQAQSSLLTSPLLILALFWNPATDWSFHGRGISRCSDFSKISQPINGRSNAKKGKLLIVKITKINDDISSMQHLDHGGGMENHQNSIIRLLFIRLLYGLEDILTVLENPFWWLIRYRTECPMEYTDLLGWKEGIGIATYMGLLAPGCIVPMNNLWSENSN